jgi:hypothetical protein
MFIRPSLLASLLLCLASQVQVSQAAPEVAGNASSAPDLSAQLLLPRSYQQHLPRLQQAAELALSTDRCERLLQGGLQLDLSRPDHPVFRILCRDQHQQSFAMLVDGISLHLLDDTRPGGSISFEDWQREMESEKERQRILEEYEARALLREAEQRQDMDMLRLAREALALEDARRKRLWEFCREQLAIKVEVMREVNWITRFMPEAHVDEANRLGFYIDFDAEDLYRQPLLYRAECRIRSEDDFQLIIRSRAPVDDSEF